MIRLTETFFAHRAQNQRARWGQPVSSAVGISFSTIKQMALQIAPQAHRCAVVHRVACKAPMTSATKLLVQRNKEAKLLES